MTGEPGAGELRLRVHAIGLNRTEVMLRSGRSSVNPPLASSTGFEAAGIIEALGPHATGFAVGDRVALVPAYGAAQYALYGEVSLAPARPLVPIPDHVSFSEAAATWVAYGTAWGGLIVIGALAAGQSVLISAASSLRTVRGHMVHLRRASSTSCRRLQLTGEPTRGAPIALTVTEHLPDRRLAAQKRWRVTFAPENANKRWSAWQGAYN